jgi:ribosomal protein L11 methyltransferase
MISNIAANATTSVASLETDEQSARRIAGLIAETFEAEQAAVSLVDKGGERWLVAIHFTAALDERTVRKLTALAAGPAAAKALRFDRVAAKDWVRESLAGLEPVAAGRFIIHGAHDRARIPINRIGIEIEAALAFGTGHHGTTRGCLLALDRICKSHHLRRVPRILDLGTGSGVLAIAAARALRRRVLATDNDARAVRAARANAALNHVGVLVEVVPADGVTARRLRQRAPFDLIFANILLGPLQRFATPLTRLAAPGARVILSGLLAAQANAAIAAYHGLALERRIDLDGWTTLVFARPVRRRASVARRRPAP